MSIEDLWNKAIKETEVIKLPLKKLKTFDETNFDYIFLSESEFDKNDTVVRKGSLRIEKPSLILPGSAPIFEGFESKDNHSTSDLSNFFFLRGISFPSLKYRNDHYELDLREESLSASVKHFEEQVRILEKISTTIVVGTSDAWQFSLIILSAMMIENQVDGDLKAIFDKIRKSR